MILPSITNKNSLSNENILLNESKKETDKNSLFDVSAKSHHNNSETVSLMSLPKNNDFFNF